MNRRGRSEAAVPALARRVVEAALEAHDMACLAMLGGLLVARRSVLTERVSAMVEEMVSDHLGVTVVTLEKARFPAGWTWWEWEPWIEGRRLPSLGPVDLDRAGVLVEADATGRRGLMHFVYSGVDDRGGRMLETPPLACAFDWREEYELPPTFEPRLALEDYRYALTHRPPDAPLGERESSPVFWAAMDRRFGFVENRFFSKGPCGSSAGLDGPTELFARLNNTVLNEAWFVLALTIVVGSARLVLTSVARDTQLAKDIAVLGTAPFDFTVLDIAGLSLAGGSA